MKDFWNRMGQAYYRGSNWISVSLFGFGMSLSFGIAGKHEDFWYLWAVSGTLHFFAVASGIRAIVEKEMKRKYDSYLDRFVSRVELLERDLEYYEMKEKASNVHRNQDYRPN